jgi:hypothetical protein
MINTYYDTEVEGNGFYDDGEDFDFYDDEIDDYYGEGSGAAEEFWGWPDELDAFELAKATNYTPEDYMSEILVEYALDMFEDSAELVETLREVLHEDYWDASPKEIEQVLFNTLEAMTPAEGFNLVNTLGQINKAGQKVLQDPTVGQIAGTALPLAGATIGGVYGGPSGALVGGQLGQAAGQAFTGGRKQTTAPANAGMASAKGGSAAAAQLLQLTQNPELLMSLLALALGEQGRKSIKVGKRGPSVPVSEIVGLLGSLGQQAAADADELIRESNDAFAYLRDSEGHFRVDPVVPADRNQLLYEALIGSENQRLADSIAAELAWEDSTIEDPEAAEAYPYWY